METNASKKYELAYYDLKDLRRQARDIERAQQRGDNTKNSDPLWRDILGKASSFYRDNPHQLELLCWIIEAEIRVHHFKGLRDGLKLLVEALDASVNNTGDQPQLSKDDLNPIITLNGIENPGTLVTAICALKIFDNKQGHSHYYWEYYQASANGDHDKIQSMRVSINNAVSTELNTMQNEIDSCLQLLATIDVLAEKIAANTLSLTHIIDHLHKYKLCIQDLNNSTHSTNVSTTQLSTNALETATNSRAEALERLLDIANFFERAEPHSPIPHLLRRTEKWGRLSFAELLIEIVSDENAREAIYHLTGIPNTNQ